MGLNARLGALALLAASLGWQASAQTTPPSDTIEQSPPPAPCEDEAYRQFDFWIGVWDVHMPDGTFAGTNTVTSEEHGCLILERWQSAGGTTGQSYNFLDPADDNWRQLWVSQGLVIDYEGGWDDETQAMSLAGLATYHATGQTLGFRGVWTKNEDGSVTQAFEQQDAETGEWAEWFTGIYTRKVVEQTEGQ